MSAAPNSSQSASVKKSISKPWKKDIKQSSLHDTLIPADHIDPINQRLTIISLIFIIQGLKLWDLWISDKYGLDSGASYLYFLFKYGSIEGILLLALPIFRIPWLTFTYQFTLVLVLASILFNIFLVTFSLASVGAFFMGLWKPIFDREVSISGSRVRQKDIFDSSSHLSGKYIVHILPESTALLNPLKESYCLEQTYSEILIPVKFNATVPSLIQLTRYDFDTLEMTTTNFTKKQLKKQKMSHPPEKITDPRISYYTLPVTEPGLYRLGQVVDSSGLNIRLYRSDVIVPRCPSAFIFSGRAKGGSHLCIGDVDLPKISVDGVPPLTVKYSKLVKGEESKFSVQSVNPEHPMQHSIKASKSSIFWNSQDPLSWASTQSLEIEMDTSLTTAGDWIYFIDEVEDALGNVVNYNRLYNNRENHKLLFSKSLGYGFEVHPRPHVSFRGCSSQIPVKLKRNGIAQLQAVLDVGIENGPYEVQLEHLPLEDSDDSGVHYTFSQNFTQQVNQVPVKEAGIYKIKSMAGKYCQGTVWEPSACIVYIPPEPAAKITFEDVEDKCAGPVGIVADISLSGTPPFTVSYRVKKNNVMISNKSKIISQTRDKIVIKPTEAGHYVYEFYRITDAIYRDVDIKDPILIQREQTIQTLAGATFVNPQARRKACSGDSVELPVSLFGVPPFKLNYEIIHGSSRKTSYTQDGIGSSRFVINTGSLKAGGSYTVSLVSVENSKGCVTTLKEPDVVIDVSRMRPTAGFLAVNGKWKLMTLEGSTLGLPTKFSGEGPWTVVYTHTNVNGTVNRYTQTMAKQNGEMIRVNAEGNYTLESVRGAYCPGEITPENNYEVRWLERPTLSIIPNSLEALSENHYRRAAVCEQDDDVLELSLTGSSPFKIFYDVLGPRTLSNQKLDVGTKYASIILQTHKPGLYKYKFTGVADDVYGEQEMGRFSFSTITVEQTVNPRPAASFSDRGKTYKTCSNNNGKSNDDGIPILLNGKAPFSVSYSVYHESTGKTDIYTVDGIEEKKFYLSSVYRGLGLGTHRVTLTSVSDANGCSRSAPKDDDVYIHVNDVPYSTPLTPRTNFCVGERIGFSLNGVGPFDITYEFNGKRQTVSSFSPFSRVASTPGNLTLVSLSDTSSCVVNLTHEARIVHPMPSVKISEGTTVIQDIHEGDQAEIIFSLYGTPPFSFTYTRSEMVGNPPRLKVVETNTVNQVYTREYSIFTSLQGTYEAIAVEDAFCSISSESFSSHKQ